MALPLHGARGAARALLGSLLAGITGGACAGEAPSEPEPRAITVGVCRSPVPLLALGQPTGFELCVGGYYHRASVQTCPSELPRGETCSATGDAGTFACTRDADCAERANGYCWTSDGFTCGCSYGCTSDADCDAGQVCLCGTPIGVCSPASCETDADCGDLLCTSYTTSDCRVGFACQTRDDHCAGDVDCDGGECFHDGTRHQCGPHLCAGSGRPFRVSGVSRRARPVALDGWSSAGVVVTAPARLHARLAQHWITAGLDEHASVASFARFVLDLLALGAPADLVIDATEAASDEVRHAQACFDLARAYGGVPVGPAPLAIDGALVGRDVEAILDALWLEGCVGETCAALEAAEACARAEDPTVRRVLAGIAEDEARHAALAWRALAWLVGRRPELAAVLAVPRLTAPSGGEQGLDEQGVPSREVRAQIADHARERVIAPALACLLATSERAASVASDASGADQRARGVGVPERAGPRSAPGTSAT